MVVTDGDMHLTHASGAPSNLGLGAEGAEDARRTQRIPVRYDDLMIDNGYRVDILVNDRVVVELKAVETILRVHRAQLLSYLRLSGFKLGYLLNFDGAHMRDGITRMVNGL